MADLDLDQHLELCGRRLGEFELRERLDEGGFGVIYRCAQPLLEREAVVKVLRQRMRRDDVALQRFAREAFLAARLDHPYAVHVYAFGIEEDGLVWIAMEMVHGVSLARWLTEHGPMTLDQFMPFFERVTQVVQAAHARGIVHRDVKPSNIMVVECAGELMPKLLDFGVARLVGVGDVALPAPSLGPSGAPGEDAPQSGDPERTVPLRPRRAGAPSAVPGRLTPSSAAVGSPPYMAPEQWTDPLNVGPASDLYALGVVAYEALTGAQPFYAETAEALGAVHQNAPVPPVGAGLPPSLDQVFARALAKRPEDRFRGARELAAALRAVADATLIAQIRSAAKQWHERGRLTGLLWRDDALADLERLVRRTGGTSAQTALTPTEIAFINASREVASSQAKAHARRAAWIRRAAIAVAVVMVTIVVGVFQYRAAYETRVAQQEARTAQQVTEATALTAEVEQGRAAVLHDNLVEAQQHLAEAYRRGDHSPATSFMLARALQPLRAELARFPASSGRMWSAAFSPDGRQIVTTDDRAAQIWDAETHQLLFTMSHGDTVYQAVYSPDGSKIITAGADGTVRIWSAATGAPVRELTHQRAGAKQWRYSAVATSSHVVVAIDSMGRAAHVWDADTGTEIAELANDASQVASLAFSADGHWLATSGGDDVRVFDTSTWAQAVVIAGPRVRSLSFDPTGPHLVVGTNDGVASIWDIPSGERIRRLREAGEPVDAVVFSPDGSLIATASRDGAEQIWDAKTGGLRSQFNSHHSRIYAVEFAPIPNLMLSAGADGAVVVSNVATGIPIARLEGPQGLVIAAHFDLGARHVLGASWDGTARVWDAASPYERWGSPAIGAECDTVDSVDPDQRVIAISCRRHGTHVWDTARGHLLAELPDVTPVEGDYHSALPALTATGDRAAIARGNTVEVYALPGGQLVRTIAHTAAVNAVAFAPAGHDLVSGALDGSLLITRDARDPIVLPPSHAGIDAATILADGRVVAADASRRLRVIDPSGKAPLVDLEAPSRVRSFRSSPGGTRLITIPTIDKLIPPALWDLDRLRLVAQLDGHVGRVFAARFVAGGHEILTAGSDGTARLWDAVTGSARRSYHGDSHFLADVTLAPDGAMVVAGGSDGLLRFWDTSSGRLLWMLQAHKAAIVGVHYEGSDLVARAITGDVSRWTLPKPEAVIEACHASACAPATLTEK